jgi:hypothetical protein
MTEAEAIRAERLLTVWNTQMVVWLTNMVIATLPAGLDSDPELAVSLNRVRTEMVAPQALLVDLQNYYRESTF